MKRCPQCNRVETDEALKFCRLDGTTLVAESAGLATEAGTAALGSARDASEVHTSILPPHTDESITRGTGPTTMLPLPVPVTTGTLAKRKSRKAVVVVVGVTALFAVVAAIVVNSYFSKSGTVIDSIAVMPFVNESGNQDAEYLADGMTETLIKSLSNLPNLNVKPRSSVFRYKGKDIDLRTIAGELNVQAILNGRVVQRGDQLILSLELIDIRNDKVIWTEQYHRKASDLVSLQSDLAKDVSRQIKARLSGAEEAQVAKAGTTDTQAYEAYLKGRYHWNRRTTVNIKKALEEFRFATERDPNYAQAYVGLADCYGVLNEYAGEPSSETLPKAKSYAERALALDSKLGEAHATLGMIEDYLWNFQASEEQFKRAIETNPTYPSTYHWYSILLRNLGRFDESEAMIRRAQELDPVSRVIAVNFTRVKQVKKEDDASIRNALKIIELDPNFPPAYQYLALSYLRQGRKSEAISFAEKSVELSNRSAISLGDLGFVYASVDRKDDARALIKELEAKHARREANGLFIGVIYAGLGERDKMFEWLEKDFAARNGQLVELRWQIQFDSVRDDPRFKDLLKRMNLPE